MSIFKEIFQAVADASFIPEVIGGADYVVNGDRRPQRAAGDRLYRRSACVTGPLMDLTLAHGKLARGGGCAIDIRALAKQLNVALFAWDADDSVQSAMYKPSDPDAGGQASVTYNKSLLSKDKRFLIAYSLANKLVGQQEVTTIQSARPISKPENLKHEQATAIALEWLVPSSAFRPLVESGRFKDLEELSAVFGVFPLVVSCAIFGVEKTAPRTQAVQGKLKSGPRV